MYDFSKVETIKDQNYLKPGKYMLHPSKVELEKPAGKKAYLNITFTGKEGIVKQKFYLSDKALPNLLYLHEGLFDKGITKAFESDEQLHAYFERALTGKVIEKPYVVGATIADNGKSYCELPYGKFLIKSDSYELGAFDVDSPEYNEFVRKNTTTGGDYSSSLSSDSSIMPGDDNDAPSEDLPW